MPRRHPGAGRLAVWNSRAECQIRSDVARSTDTLSLSHERYGNLIQYGCRPHRTLEFGQCGVALHGQRGIYDIDQIGGTQKRSFPHHVQETFYQ